MEQWEIEKQLDELDPKEQKKFLKRLIKDLKKEEWITYEKADIAQTSIMLGIIVGACLLIGISFIGKSELAGMIGGLSFGISTLVGSILGIELDKKVGLDIYEATKKLEDIHEKLEPIEKRLAELENKKKGR